MPPVNKITFGDIYSQALNFDDYGQCNVDVRTGQWTYSLDIFEISSARNVGPFSLYLKFNPLSDEDVGLGKGWNFNLSYFCDLGSKSKILYLSTGDYFQVTMKDPGTPDEAVFLKDQKLKTFTFSTDDDTGVYVPGKYKLIYKSGEVHFLEKGTLWDRSVCRSILYPNGRRLDFTWIDHPDAKENNKKPPRLQYIKDNNAGSNKSVKLLEIDYTKLAQTPAYVTVTRNPDITAANDTKHERGSLKFIIESQSKQLTEVELASYTACEDDDKMKKLFTPKWDFKYDIFYGLCFMKKVVTPTGLIEEITHKKEGHKINTNDFSLYLPYVEKHISNLGGLSQNIVTEYKYTTANFLGYQETPRFQWSSSEDNAYRVGESAGYDHERDYSYTTTTTVGGLSTTYTYNRFHLLTSTKTEFGSLKSVSSDLTYYADTKELFNHQLHQYLLPRTVQKEYKAYKHDKKAESDASSYAEITELKFDEWGNPISVKLPDGSERIREYYEAQPDGEDAKVCPRDPHFFKRHVKSDLRKPAGVDSGLPIRKQVYEYSAVPWNDKNVGSERLVVPTKTKFYTNFNETNPIGNRISMQVESKYFDRVESNQDLGRLKSRVTKIPKPGKKVDDTGDSDKPYENTQEMSYIPSSDNSELTQVSEVKTHDGLKIQDKTIISMFNQRPISRINGSGSIIRYTYDALGHLRKEETAPPPAVGQQPVYTMTQKFDRFFPTSSDNSYSVLSFDGDGLVTSTRTDGIGRVVEVSRALNSERDAKGLFKLKRIKRNEYDDRGRLVTVLTTDWGIDNTTNDQGVALRESYEYGDADDWGELKSVYKTRGLDTKKTEGYRVTTTWNPITRTSTTRTEDEGEYETVYSKSGKPCQINRYKYINNGNDPSGKPITLRQAYSKIYIAYDNLGRRAKWYQGPSLGLSYDQWVKRTDKSKDTSYTYDEWDRPSVVTFPDLSTQKYIYAPDSIAERVKEIEAQEKPPAENGRVAKKSMIFSKELDGLGRTTKETVGSIVKSYKFDTAYSTTASTVEIPSGPIGTTETTIITNTVDPQLDAIREGKITKSNSQTFEEKQTFDYDRQTGDLMGITDSVKDTANQVDTTSSVTLGYDKYGALEKQTVKQSANTATNTTKWTYSLLGNVLSRNDPISDSDESQYYEYDEYRRLSTLSLGKKNATGVIDAELSAKFEYDSVGRLTKRIVQGRPEAKDKYRDMVGDFTYDDFGRQKRRSATDRDFTPGQTKPDQDKMYDIDLTYNEKDQLVERLTSRQISPTITRLMKKETFKYDDLGRLTDWIGSDSEYEKDHYFPTGDSEVPIVGRRYEYDYRNNVTMVETTFSSKNYWRLRPGYMAKETQVLQYAASDPTQLERVTYYKTSAKDISDAKIDRKRSINFVYDRAGQVTKVTNLEGNVINEVKYDAVGQLEEVHDRSNKREVVNKWVPGQLHQQNAIRLTYDEDNKVVGAAGESTGNDFNTKIDMRYFRLPNGECAGFRWRRTRSGPRLPQPTVDKVYGLAWTDEQGSILTLMNGTWKSNSQKDFAYLPFGRHSVVGSWSNLSMEYFTLGYQGQYYDHTTLDYQILGDGTRVYNPVYGRCFSPNVFAPSAGQYDSNPYLCSGVDPISTPINPSGPSKFLGLDFRTWLQFSAGMFFGIGVAIGTGNVMAGILAGAAAETAVGTLYDLATGTTPTAESMGTDFALGVAGGTLGYLGGRFIFNPATKAIWRQLVRRGATSGRVMSATVSTFRTTKGKQVLDVLKETATGYSVGHPYNLIPDKGEYMKYPFTGGPRNSSSKPDVNPAGGMLRPDVPVNSSLSNENGIVKQTSPWSGSKGVEQKLRVLLAASGRKGSGSDDGPLMADVLSSLEPGGRDISFSSGKVKHMGPCPVIKSFEVPSWDPEKKEPIPTLIDQ